MTELKHPRLWFALGYAMLALVAYVSLIPVTIDVADSDKLLHLVTYFLLSAFFTTLVQNARRLWRVVPGLILFGVLIEILQGLTGYRYLEIMDMLANSLGVLVGVLVRLTPVPVWFRRLESRLF